MSKAAPSGVPSAAKIRPIFNCDSLAQARDRLGSTVSVGLALAEDGESDEAMVARADAALYEAKRLGRNRTVIAKPSTP